jgi:hypothetical protein
VTFVSRPKRAPSDDSGLWVARHLLQAAVTLHLTRLLAFRITGVTGLHEGAMQAAPTSLRNPRRDLHGFGFGAVAALPIGPHRLLVSVDGSVISVPSYIEATCLDPCDGDTFNGEQRDVVLHGTANFGYAYRKLDWLSPYVSLTLQNHPTNSEEFTSREPNAEVFIGPLYATAALGIEWQPIPWLGLAPVVQWPVTRRPIEYGPIVGLGIRGIVPGYLYAP